MYARSTVTGTFSRQLTARVAVRQSAPIVFLDRPAAGAIVSSPFVLSGWALDPGAPAGTGVDAIHVWAYPVAGGPAVWVGAATYGTSRPDVGAYYGAQFGNAGFTLAGAALAPGAYDLVLFPHSTLSAAFSTPLVVRVTAR